jgi:RNA polymerase-binding transcription factor DksA
MNGNRKRMPGQARDDIDQSARVGARQRLEERYLALRKEISEGLLKADHEQYEKLAGEVGDIAEHSVADLLVDLDLAEIDRDVQELREVELALQRLNAGSYGLCMDCGEAIAERRLESQVSAVRCIKCQEVLERRRGAGVSHSL